MRCVLNDNELHRPIARFRTVVRLFVITLHHVVILCVSLSWSCRPDGRLYNASVYSHRLKHTIQFLLLAGPKLIAKLQKTNKLHTQATENKGIGNKLKQGLLLEVLRYMPIGLPPAQRDRVVSGLFSVVSVYKW